MLNAVSRSLVIMAVFLVPVLIARGVDILSAAQPGGPSAESLATNISDSVGGVVPIVGSASFTINATGNPDSDARSIGTFSNGATTAGTLLPAANQNLAGDAQYAGGIGVDGGICLCTGYASDAADQSTPVGRGVGVEGPNNGFGPAGVHPGEIGQILGTPVDQDFATVTGLPGMGDSSVLQFQVEISSPGFLRIDTVFGSDEFPHFIEEQFNDSFAILIDGQNVATITKNSVVTPFSLQDVAACPQLFLKNDVAPSPSGLVGSNHAVPGAPLYDVEFGGFTAPLTFETCDVLAPGIYTVKVVVQDVADQQVDAGLFIPENSLKLFSFLRGDVELDGDVDADDLAVLLNFWDPNATDRTFTQGNVEGGDGDVDADDLSELLNFFGETGGNKNFCADFNRDG